MKTLFLSLSMFCGIAASIAQSTKPTNVYPSNLEENMYYKVYDASSNSITGLYFMVLSDGNNSRDKTPAFEVTLYLMPEGKTSREDITIIKVYELAGIYHMGSHEFKNETISLEGFDIKPGPYRLGIWVNSNEAFSEDTSDNATLFRGTMQISASTNGKPALQKKEEKKKKEEEQWEEWED